MDSDDCTTPSEHTPFDSLPLVPELLRITLNGQQYSGGFPHHIDAPSRPNLWSDFSAPSPGFRSASNRLLGFYSATAPGFRGGTQASETLPGGLVTPRECGEQPGSNGGLRWCVS